MRNYQQRTEDFNNRMIVRKQGNIEGAPGFGGGMQEDVPNPEANALRALEDYLCFQDRLEPRGGSKVWSNTTLPPLLGRTGYSITKSGTTVAKSAGTDFSAADVGNYIVYDDGVHERITAYIGTTSVTVENSTAHAASTAGWVHGPLNMVAYHRKQKRVVILIDTRFFISSTVSIGAWYQIFKSGGTAPTSTYSTYDEMGDYLIVGNANGIFKLDCEAAGTGAEPCVYWKVNESITCSAGDGGTTENYLYKYVFCLARIKGTSLVRSRVSDTVESASAPSSTYNGSRDYVLKGSASAIGDGAGMSLNLTLAPTNTQYTHVSAFRSLNIGVDGKDPQTGKGNNEELLVWVGDFVPRRPFVGSISGTTLTSTTSVFREEDVGLLVQYNTGMPSYHTIASYTSPTAVEIEDLAEATNVSFAIGSASFMDAVQAVLGTETVGNATVTKQSGPGSFSEGDVGSEVIFPLGLRSLIVRYIDSSNVEVATSDAVLSTCVVVGGPSSSTLIDIVDDDTLRRRSAGFSLKNRFTVPMPNSNIVSVAGGLLWGAVRDSGDICYSQIPNNEEYYAGFYRPSGDGAQIDTLPDGIQDISKFMDRLVFYCNQSAWFIATNDFSTVTLPEVGEVIQVATGHWPLAEIGLKDYGSRVRVAGVRTSDMQNGMGDIMVCSDGGVRICNGSSFSSDLAINRVSRALLSHAVRSSAAYDSINGYMLWRSDDTINDATHSYRFGIEPDVQGTGWSKNINGDPVMTFARMGGIIVIDSNNHFRSLILDKKTGLFYDISTRDGPTGSGLTKLWKDKVALAGTGGTDISPAAEFIPERGTEEHFTIEHKESHIYTRPYKESSGYPSGLEFTMSIYRNVETTAKAQTAGVDGDNDISFDKKVEGNQLRIRVSANKADHLLTGRLNNYLAKDRGAAPSDRTMAEKTYQKSLGNVLLWVGPHLGSLVNRVTGAVIEASPSLTTGPDGYSDSAIGIEEILTCPSVNVTNKTLLVWATGPIAITIGGTAVSLADHGVVGDFTLYYATVTGNGDVVITPPDEREIADFRILDETLSAAARAYYFDDVDDNAGKVVMPR